MFGKILPLLVLLAVCADAVPKKKHTKRARDLIVNKRAFCDDDEFVCADYECVSFNDVCDTVDDCSNSKDEEGCPSDCTGPHQFKCEHDGKCISHQLRCDDRVDCTDWSDEAGCANYDCLEGYVHCLTSHACVNENYLCDGLADCKDGSDEASSHCPHVTCAPDEFQCTGSGKCYTKLDQCDGYLDCSDGSDEKNCVCDSDEFKCSSGRCIMGFFKCDNNDDCGDGSDEMNCPGIPAGDCSDLMTVLDCHLMNTTSHPICFRHDTGFKFCRKFCNLCTN